MNNPLISVVLPLRDRARHAATAVRSVLDQTYRPIELIIVDSTTTLASCLPEIEVIAADAPQGVSVRVISNKNCSAAQSINEGLRAAGGEYIALLSADDAYAPVRLERCLAASKGAGVVITYIAPLDGDGRPLGIGDRWRVEYGETLLHHLAVHPTLSCLSVFRDIVATTGNLFISRDILATVGEFSDFPHLHYLDFFLRAALLVEPFVIREKLLFHRVHPGSSVSNPAYLEEHAAIIRKHLLNLMTGSRPANPLADVFVTHPFFFGQTSWTEPLNRAFDDLLEYRDPPDEPATVGNPHAQHRHTDVQHEFTLVSHELSLTGAPVIVLELASLLRERGCSVKVLSLIDGPLRPEFTKRGIHVKTPPVLLDRMARLQAQLQHWAHRGQRLPERILYRLSRHMREFTEWIWQMRLRSNVEGILILNSICSWPLAVKLTGNWKGPAFWYIHESMDAQSLVLGEQLNLKLQRLVADGRLKMLYGSDATRLHWASNGYSGQRCYWSGISRTDHPPRTASNELREKRARRVILNVGMVGGRKGTRTLVEAFALGRTEGMIPDDVDLCIVGGGRPSQSPEARDLILRTLQPDLRGHVRLAHSVLPGALLSYYDEADVYAHGSLFDCMPIALLTAMARGMPIVTTDADGCKEAILHESCGYLVQPGQPRQMAEALGKLLTQPDKARAFGDAARARFVERFSVEATFEPLFDTLVGRAAAP